MAGFKAVAAAMLLVGMTLAPAAAQMSEPAFFDAQNPGRSAINGGALTPWGEAQAAQRGSPASAYGAMPPPASPVCARYHSFDPASGTYLGRDGRRHACQ
ncbi:BA14K family protein [Bradyrhizobium tropiciagri]|uniref:BA14K family protein n=1 Tax=Bradyrhizobium tropiciagri TaxID=312253 RepID=UPI001BAC8E57|nr:BA14K family protein [Bradyrhizobium tropiciagri]MBR0874797.1 BA14K family protein [Bradyrhizobium tropiciagri]